ncbi:FAD-dependent oxidoreductase [Roseovarius aestuarii]|nr:FAD-dependent oxidoreductase [Roseovarius aestuarii]
MPTNPRYDILFQPLKIGPKTTKNRFFQVPHASGMTNAAPNIRAAFRGMKAEGGWGVICTGACSVDDSSDDSPFPFATLWDNADIRAHRLTTDAVHAHGALAGVELWHGGAVAVNRTSRMAPLSPSGVPWMATHVGFMSSARPRVMDSQDIKNLIQWHRDAAIRAEEAGFDIHYVYAGMGYLPYQFLLSDYNHRTDDYGGSVANRTRLIVDLIDAVREATHGRNAVALRISMQELRGRPSDIALSEAHEVIDLLKDAPDLFDVKMDTSAYDCSPSRFTAEGSHEPVINFIKTITDKPVVGVGRFTSPDTMVGQIKRGVLDLIGGARPSIADPYLPLKIQQGREDDIRECIGCNICISSWHDGVPVRCTQNPTAGEEWRRGWHPEIVTRDSADQALVIGGGPSGLETALTLARRGMTVAVAESKSDFGGRVLFESRLPGLGQWARVIDYRLGQLRKMANVSLYAESELKTGDVTEFGADHVIVATGATWTQTLCGANELPGGFAQGPRIYTPDDLAHGEKIEGPVAVFDYDAYYMGGAVAEALARDGLEVQYITTAGAASAWTIMTNEQPQIHETFAKHGIGLHTLHVVDAFDGETVTLAQMYSGQKTTLAARSLMVVGMRVGGSALFDCLVAAEDGPKSLFLTGDANAPGAIAHAVYQGHKTAREVAAQVTKPRRDAAFASENME